jgi:hypothetical protein
MANAQFESPRSLTVGEEAPVDPLGVVSSFLLQLDDPYRKSIVRRKRSNSEPFLYSWDFGNINVDVQLPGISMCYVNSKNNWNQSLCTLIWLRSGRMRKFPLL